VAVVTGASEVREVTCLAAVQIGNQQDSIEDYSDRDLPTESDITHISLELIGPSCGSYRPPRLGRLRLSSSTGLSIFLTEIALMSSVERKEKEIEVTSEWREWAMSILSDRSEESDSWRRKGDGGVLGKPLAALLMLLWGCNAVL
jgi:hypothetical protein